MIVIIDYGVGNLRSVQHKVTKLEIDSFICSDPEEISKADKIILPGVGSFAIGIDNLQKKGFVEVLNKKVLEEKIPILGICLGMQLLTKKSEEGNVNGLGWIDAETKKFSFKEKNLRIPHVGWNSIDIKKDNILFKDIPQDTYFYFTHSYHVCCKDKKDILTTTNYGYDFVSSIQKDNIYGVQFHPEKSHKIGMKIIKNFAELG